MMSSGVDGDAVGILICGGGVIALIVDVEVPKNEIRDSSCGCARKTNTDSSSDRGIAAHFNVADGDVIGICAPTHADAAVSLALIVEVNVLDNTVRTFQPPAFRGGGTVRGGIYTADEDGRSRRSLKVDVAGTSVREVVLTVKFNHRTRGQGDGDGLTRLFRRAISIRCVSGGSVRRVDVVEAGRGRCPEAGNSGRGFRDPE